LIVSYKKKEKLYYLLLYVFSHVTNMSDTLLVRIPLYRPKR